MRSTSHGEPMAQRLRGGASARYRVIPLDSFDRRRQAALNSELGSNNDNYAIA